MSESLAPRIHKNQARQDEENKNLRDVHVSDFIPYACHWDANTILTKNGELLQTIKITGFSREQVGSGSEVELRDAVRKALFASLDCDKYAIWFHTIRRKKNLDPGGNFPDGFPSYLNRRWAEHHDWSNKYINELYITIVREGEKCAIRNPIDYMRALWPPAERRARWSYLEEAFTRLDKATSSIIDRLSMHGARRLTIIEKDGESYSEPMQFFDKLINLHERPTHVPVADISKTLPDHNIAFGFNLMEVKGETGTHYASLLTVKYYRELTTTALDEFLQLPQEFIISQCIDFLPAKKVLKHYDGLRKSVNLSEDNELARVSGLNDIDASNKGNAIDYGEHQLSVMLLADDPKSLEKNIYNANAALGDLGIVAMREDIRLEEVYWSQLPANFYFVRRQQPINTIRSGGFASLYNFPAGQVKDNHWGPAVTVFYTAAGTPYFFNFHHQQSGHTAIIGPYGSGKTVMLNFLCSESQKFNGRLFFFDKDRGSEVFINALGGRYHKMLLGPKHGEFKLNPLLVSTGENPKAFHKEWLESLVFAHGDEVSAEDNQAIDSVVNALQDWPTEQRRLSTIAQWLTDKDATHLVECLQDWHGNGQWAYLFDHASDDGTLDGSIYGFEMGNIIQEDTPLQPMLLYLIYRINETLDGTPTIIVLDEAWEMLDNPTFAPKIAGWLEHWSANNAVAIVATESVKEASSSNITGDIFDHISTEIYFPNKKAGNDYKDIFRLNKDEFRMLRKMLPDQRQFMLKHAGNAVVAHLNLAGMEDVLGVLSSSAQHRAIFEQITTEMGNQPADWLPTYQHRCLAIEDSSPDLEEEH